MFDERTEGVMGLAQQCMHRSRRVVGFDGPSQPLSCPVCGIGFAHRQLQSPIVSGARTLRLRGRRRVEAPRVSRRDARCVEKIIKQISVRSRCQSPDPFEVVFRVHHVERVNERHIEISKLFGVAFECLIADQYD